MGLEQNRNYIGTESSVPLASVRVLDYPYPTMSMSWGHGVRPRRREYIMWVHAFQNIKYENNMKDMCILKVNPSHHFFKNILGGHPAEDSGYVVEGLFSDTAWVIYEMDLINGGSPHLVFQELQQFHDTVNSDDDRL